MNELDTVATLWRAHDGLHTLLMLMALCSIRLLVVFVVLPATSDQVLSGGTRNGVVYVISLFIAAGQPADTLSRLDAMTALIIVGKEMFIGLVIGYAASAVFWVAQSVGVVIDNMAGFNNVQTSNPLRGEQSTPISNVLIQLAIVLFYVAGGMLFLLATVFESFRWWPLTATLPSLDGVAQTFLISRVDSVAAATVKLAAPVMLVLVLIDLAFGLVAKAADKLEPMSLSQPVRGAVALLMLVLLTGAFIEQVKPEFTFQHFQAFIQHGVLGTAR
ncbi:type III secretion protein T [Duganella sp. SG902]|uniref:type III secretion system export apparatus subunit SctT n=1 Tax=Duganella sp. SG902 TaxID=2587016 RepID=UPI00159DF81D|nr:type III secretion system export apparatus subunit SctT [Duganella sp. SG902]NVM77647.1 type III secretion protein T [Duganella sp. SG902]